MVCAIIIHSNLVFAHLCDDVFLQAKNNLAVKIKNDIKIDGLANRREWGKFLLCASLHEYVGKKSKIPWLKVHSVNQPAKTQTRFRLIYDDNFLYCLIDFQKTSNQDIATLYFASDYKSMPLKVSVSLKDKKVNANILNFSSHVKFNDSKAELKIPLRYIGLKNKSFYVNFKRIHAGKISYWKGNNKSVNDPIVYGKLILN